jgi:hypothetical protein
MVKVGAGGGGGPTGGTPVGMTRVHRFETKPVGPFGRRISCQWGTDPTSSSSLPGWRLDSGALRGGASSDDDMGRNVGGRCDGVGVDVRPRQEAEAENGESEESTEGPRAAPDRRGVTHVVLLVDSAGGMPVRHTICWNAHPRPRAQRLAVAVVIHGRGGALHSRAQQVIAHWCGARAKPLKAAPCDDVPPVVRLDRYTVL